MTNLVFPTEKFTSLKLFSKGGECQLSRATIQGIKGIWN
jgi:hypothetical protein